MLSNVREGLSQLSLDGAAPGHPAPARARGARPELSDRGDGGVSYAIVLHSCGYMESATVDASVFQVERARSRLVPVLRAWVLALGVAPVLA